MSPGPNLAAALWAFLDGRRGERFCTDCLAKALVTVKRIDRAVIAAEGRGATRRYAACSVCGKARLVTGLSR